MQVYLPLPSAADALGVRQPPKRLVGFYKIDGASGEVSVTIDPSASNHPLAGLIRRILQGRLPGVGGL